VAKATWRWEGSTSFKTSAIAKRMRIEARFIMGVAITPLLQNVACGGLQ